MRDPIELGRRFDEELGGELQVADYLYADTRVPAVSLYDHLRLTAGMAVALVRELHRRGAAPNEIVGLQGDARGETELCEEELRAVARLAGLLHDLGKAREGQTDPRGHVSRGVEYARAWLERHGVAEPLLSILLGAVARHHLRDRPQTPLEKVVCLADSYASAGDRPELAQARTAEEFQRVAQEVLRLERELFGDDKPVCLLLGDADAIKGYVYETSALPEIRGASEILQELEREVRQLFAERLCEEALIYCGGGGFLAVVPASEAEAFQRETERLYGERTGLATLTVVPSGPIGYAELARGLEPHDDERVEALSGGGLAQDLIFSHFEALLTDRARRKNFGERVVALTGRLQQEKRAKSSAPFLEALPVHRRCESCGKRAAVTRDQVREEWICAPCLQKREKGRAERREFLDKFADWAEERGLSVSKKLPTDLDTLAGSDGRIALLYADGNNMGDLLQLMPSPASYRHLSQVLEQATREALFSALWSVFGEERLADPKDGLPFEIIALGGDDIVVLVPARYGWALALHVLREFRQHKSVTQLEDELAQRLRGALRNPVSLSLSAGLAIADVKYPVGFLFALAEGLLKEAKRLARETRRSTLCHLWLRAPILAENAREMLDALYRHPEGSRWLSGRPYTLDQACELTRIARQLAENVPIAQVRSLAEALEKGVHVSLNYALYQAARQEERGARLRRAFEELGKLLDPASGGFWFWRQMDEGWKTALLDAVELIELSAELNAPKKEDEHVPSAAG